MGITAAELYSTGRYSDALAIPEVISLHENDDECASRKITMKRGAVSLHSLLPETEVWGYEGQFPGPTIEVRSGKKVRIEWKNQIKGQLPVVPVHAATLNLPDGSADADFRDMAENVPGLSGATPDPMTDPVNLDPYTVVHVHGARVAPDSDGWTDNVCTRGQSTLSTYENTQRSTLLWYHDHAMGVTRMNVYSGLAGLYIIRDDEDDRILQALRATRPVLKRHHATVEIPLLIQDRNLNTDASGNLTGELVHKVEDGPVMTGDVGPMEFFGPFTLVNGKIWPHAAVDRLPYRLRVINGSNARTYRLVLVDAAGNTMHSSGLNYSSIVRQIGTDGGLLGEAVRLPEAGLTLASAERADLIIEFDKLPADVTALRWMNTAPAPFGNDPAPGAPSEPSYFNRIPFPDVIEFRIGGPVAGAQALNLPTPLSATFETLTHSSLPADHEHRLIALVEDDGMLTLRELEKVDASNPPMPGDPVLKIQYDLHAAAGTDPHVLTSYKVIAAQFLDTVNIVVKFGGYEAWKIINLTEDTHPFHVHLIQFQILHADGQLFREKYDTEAAKNGDLTQPVTFVSANDPDHRIDRNELGWKDTVRVNPDEMVTIAARFDGYCGRYMYHCHILEHEDHDMMRPFLVLPAALHMGHDHMMGMAMHAMAR